MGEPIGDQTRDVTQGLVLRRELDPRFRNEERED